MKANIGMFGLGNIGQGVVKIVEKNKGSIKKKTEIDLAIKTIAVRDKLKQREISPANYNLTTNSDDIINDESINIVVELIGGVYKAKEIVFKSLKQGKHVVTANKALMAEYGDEIFRLAKENNVKVNYEASVGGCIPIIKSLDVSLVSDNVNELYGILNGTTNYILTKMSKHGMSYEDALKQAQELGFAEADPYFDVSGKDAAQKLLVLSRIAFNTEIDFENIYFEGIERINQVDIKSADEMGYAIKLLAVAKKFGSSVELRVHPAFIRKDALLASVDNEINAVFVNGEMVKEQMYCGRGAGQLPTASVVVSDVVDILRRNEMDFSYEEIKPIPIDSLEMSYYLRFIVEDKPGVLAFITKTLAENNISISSIIQKTSGGKEVPVVIMTHSSKESDIKKSMKEIGSFVGRESLMIRILGN